MPVVVYERHVTGDFTVTRDSASVMRQLFAVGSTNQIEIELAVKLYAGVVFLGLVRSRISPRHQAADIWYVEVEYANIPLQQAAGLLPEEAAGGDPNTVGTPGPTEGIDPSFSFDFSGQTARIFQSRETIEARDAGPGGGAPIAGGPDNQLAIGQRDDGVEGCDIYIPQGSFEREAFRTAVTMEYLATLYRLTGTVNFAHKFFHFNEGEVLYLGASGRQVQFGKWSILHKFGVILNEAPYVVVRDSAGAPLIQFTEKKGWDYVWVRYTKEQVGNRIREIPKAAYIERVYRAGDLKQLGIGG